MARIVRNYPIMGQLLTTVVTVGTTTGTVAVTGIRPPMAGAYVEKWWVTPRTAGAGTGVMTCYLAFAAGTSSTSQISSALAFLPDVAAGVVAEGPGNPSVTIPTTALNKDCVFIVTAGTTNTAPALDMGVIWRL